MTGAGRDGDVLVVLVTGPDRDSLVDLGRRVVEEGLAACANVTDGVRSVYRWRGEVQEDDEGLALLKTTRRRIDALQSRVLELHSYDEPEFVALSVEGGSRSYLDWVVDSVQPTDG